MADPIPGAPSDRATKINRDPGSLKADPLPVVDYIQINKDLAKDAAACMQLPLSSRADMIIQEPTKDGGRIQVIGSTWDDPLATFTPSSATVAGSGLRNAIMVNGGDIPKETFAKASGCIEKAARKGLLPKP